MIELEINGMPVAWAAHKGFGRRAFNPKYKEREYVIWKIKEIAPNSFLHGPIKVEVDYHMPIPSSSSKKKQSEMLKGSIRHVKRPDLDNLNKFICDCMKKVLFEDDSQICEIFSRKIYSVSPKTVIRIFPLQKEDSDS